MSSQKVRNIRALKFNNIEVEENLPKVLKIIGNKINSSLAPSLEKRRGSPSLSKRGIQGEFVSNNIFYSNVK